MRFAFPCPRAALSERSLRLTLSATLAIAFTATSAFADEPSKADLARARSAFQEGVALAAANNCAAALVKYKEVAQVKATPQVAFNTAECEARLGKLVAALGNYRVAASQAADDKRAAQVLKEAPARVEDLEARIPKLTVTRGKGADTANIELDGTELGQSQLGQAVPVDPGTHTITAKVNGKVYLNETVKLDEKQSKTFDVKISVAGPVIEPAAPDKQDEAKPEEKKSRVPGVVLTVIGGATMIAGFAMLAPRGSAVSKLNADCNAMMHCPTGDSNLPGQANLYTGLTATLVPVGGILAITGIVLIARNGPSSKPKPADAEEKKDDSEKKEAFWRSFEVVPGAVGASLGGLSVKTTF